MSVAVSRGLPVAIEQIDQQLGRLWEESGDTKTRASLINLLVHTSDEASIDSNTEIIARIAKDHACRAILIYANPNSPDSKAQAWISAHCHVYGPAGRQVCSEQITFQLDGDMAEALPNIVFSHLDSDLPLCLWWQNELPDSVDPKLWTWVDRLLFDSRTWEGKLAQHFKQALAIQSFNPGHLVLCDLNWTRLLSTRFALAQLFDHAEAARHLEQIERVEITCGTECGSTAYLLLGWLAAQLGWAPQPLLGTHSFTCNGRPIEFSISHGEGHSIRTCSLLSKTARFDLSRGEGSGFFHASMESHGATLFERTLPAGRDRITEILLVELGRGGRHPLYSRTLDAILPLLTE